MLANKTGQKNTKTQKNAGSFFESLPFLSPKNKINSDLSMLQEPFSSFFPKTQDPFKRTAKEQALFEVMNNPHRKDSHAFSFTALNPFNASLADSFDFRKGNLIKESDVVSPKNFRIQKKSKQTVISPYLQTEAKDDSEQRKERRPRELSAKSKINPREKKNERETLTTRTMTESILAGAKQDEREKRENTKSFNKKKSIERKRTEKTQEGDSKNTGKTNKWVEETQKEDLIEKEMEKKSEKPQKESQKEKELKEEDLKDPNENPNQKIKEKNIEKSQADANWPRDPVIGIKEQQNQAIGLETRQNQKELEKMATESKPQIKKPEEIVKELQEESKEQKLEEKNNISKRNSLKRKETETQAEKRPDTKTSIIETSEEKKEVLLVPVKAPLSSGEGKVPENKSKQRDENNQKKKEGFPRPKPIIITKAEQLNEGPKTAKEPKEKEANAGGNREEASIIATREEANTMGTREDADSQKREEEKSPESGRNKIGKKKKSMSFKLIKEKTLNGMGNSLGPFDEANGSKNNPEEFFSSQLNFFKDFKQPLFSDLLEEENKAELLKQKVQKSLSNANNSRKVRMQLDTDLKEEYAKLQKDQVFEEQVFTENPCLKLQTPLEQTDLFGRKSFVTNTSSVQDPLSGKSSHQTLETYTISVLPPQNSISFQNQAKIAQTFQVRAKVSHPQQKEEVNELGEGEEGVPGKTRTKKNFTSIIGMAMDPSLPAAQKQNKEAQIRSIRNRIQKIKVEEPNTRTSTMQNPTGLLYEEMAQKEEELFSRYPISSLIWANQQSSVTLREIFLEILGNDIKKIESFVFSKIPSASLLSRDRRNEISKWSQTSFLRFFKRNPLEIDFIVFSKNFRTEIYVKNSVFISLKLENLPRIEDISFKDQETRLSRIETDQSSSLKLLNQTLMMSDDLKECLEDEESNVIVCQNSVVKPWNCGSRFIYKLPPYEFSASGLDIDMLNQQFMEKFDQQPKGISIFRTQGSQIILNSPTLRGSSFSRHGNHPSNENVEGVLDNGSKRANIGEKMDEIAQLLNNSSPANQKFIIKQFIDDNEELLFGKMQNSIKLKMKKPIELKPAKNLQNISTSQPQNGTTIGRIKARSSEKLPETDEIPSKKSSLPLNQFSTMQPESARQKSPKADDAIVKLDSNPFQGIKSPESQHLTNEGIKEFMMKSRTISSKQGTNNKEEGDSTSLNTGFAGQVGSFYSENLINDSSKTQSYGKSPMRRNTGNGPKQKSETKGASEKSLEKKMLMRVMETPESNSQTGSKTGEKLIRKKHKKNSLKLSKMSKSDAVLIGSQNQSSMVQHKKQENSRMDIRTFLMKTHLLQNHRLNEIQRLEDKLFFVLEKNHVYEFRELMSELSINEINTVNANGDSFLTLAAKLGNAEIISDLLRKGANINHQNVRSLGFCKYQRSLGAWLVYSCLNVIGVLACLESWLIKSDFHCELVALDVFSIVIVFVAHLGFWIGSLGRTMGTMDFTLRCCTGTMNFAIC